MASSFQPDIPSHVAAVIRGLHPDLKRLVRAAIDEIVANPESGKPPQDELAGYRRYPIRRFRLVYSIDKAKRRIEIVIVAHRREVYEMLSTQLEKAKPES